MVKLGALLALLAAGLAAEGVSPTATALSPAALSVSPSAQALSGTAQALSPSADALLPLSPRPLPPLKTVNSGWESFAGVTLLSAPFTAFWAVLGALAVEGFAQGQFPPDFGQDRAKATLSAAAAAAVGSSVCIGLVSIQWGGSHAPAPASPTAQALPGAPKP